VSVVGVDPAPGAHGVGRYTQGIIEDRSIIQGFAENLPFNDASFDVVFSSHVLEHVASVEASLLEMKRVLKPGGVLIIGMPTRTMTIVAFISHFCFTSHVNVLFFLKSLFSFQKDVLDRFIHVFLPTSHSFPNARYIFHDFRFYSIRNWRKIILKYWKIENKLMPMLYPYPDYIQWFPMLKSKYLSSSVFFICRK
jgi:ubiquinone/menaquinone biosynthesis C-methylase UbiE